MKRLLEGVLFVLQVLLLIAWVLLVLLLTPWFPLLYEAR